MKKKIDSIKFRCGQITSGVAVAAATVSTQISTFAKAADAADAMEWIISTLGTLIIAGGIIFGIMGLVAYASAHSEGDGPAQNKAMGKIIAGIMLIALSVILKTQAGEIAGLISN